jgi:hypothetical protein
MKNVATSTHIYPVNRDQNKKRPMRTSVKSYHPKGVLFLFWER